jgi:hypothetical protein
MTDFAAWGKFDADAAAEVVDKEVCSTFATILSTDPLFCSKDPTCLNLPTPVAALQADREQKKRELRAKEASAAAQDVSHMHQTHSLECDCIPLRSFGALHTYMSTVHLVDHRIDTTLVALCLNVHVFCHNCDALLCR